MDAADTLAVQLSETAVAEDLPALLEYCDRSLAASRPARPLEVWNRLCVNRLLPFERLDREKGILLTDGRFDRPATGRGFDWRLSDTDGVISRRLPGDLRVTFSGRQADWCAIAWQYLALQPGSRYRLRWKIHGIDESGADGVVWKIYDLAGRRVAAENGDAASLTFVAPAGELVLMLSYERPVGSPRLDGAVAVTQAALGTER
jgi:hypothetical protein